MPAATVGGGAGQATGAPTAQVPFMVGSNKYRELVFTDTFTLGANAVEFVHNITPGGFLRGVRLIVTSASGVIGTGVLAADGPFTLFSSISLENIDGSPIKYPMTGYSYFLENMYTMPWLGDPRLRNGEFSNTINPSFTLFIKPEIRWTAGVLANTDARAQYRIRYTANSLAGFLGTVGTATTPTVTVRGILESWAQTDQTDLHGNPIASLPDGLSLGRILRQDIKTLNGAGADNQLQFSNTGNEYRCIIVVVRDSLGARQDYLSDPIRFRVDDRSMWTMSPAELFASMNDVYTSSGIGTMVRPTGVYVIPRFRNPGDLDGEFWMPTSNATYVVLQSATVTGGANLPGTVQIITDEVVPITQVPLELEGI